MDISSIFQTIVDNWLLIWMFSFFFAVVVWVFRPGSGKKYKDTANIPFRHEFKPAGDGEDNPDTNPEEVR